MKTVFAGLESSGKSLLMAERIRARININTEWRRKKLTLRPRHIVTSLKLSKKLEDRVKGTDVLILYWNVVGGEDYVEKEKANNPNLRYIGDSMTAWVGLRGVDMFIDEIGTYLDARTYADLPQRVRYWLAQADKSGVNIYGTAQDFAQIDNTFRRLAKDNIYEITKVFSSPRPDETKPKVNYIYGFCIVRRIKGGADYDEKSKDYANWFMIDFIFNWYWIKRSVTSLYDTLQFASKPKPIPYEHSIRFCPYIDENGKPCGYQHIKHI